MVESFSYEDLYELLHAEKAATDLQGLTPEQLGKIREYFEAKKALLYKERTSEIFDRSKRDKLRIELENARRALKDLYEKREKKIINRAMFTARSAFKLRDTTNMLPSEQELYDKLVELLKIGWASFFKELNTAKSSSQEEPKLLKETSKRLLKFNEAVPELMDTELNKYGPFEANQVASLPDELADLLIQQKKVTEIKDETPKNN